MFIVAVFKLFQLLLANQPYKNTYLNNIKCQMIGNHEIVDISDNKNVVLCAV